MDTTDITVTVSTTGTATTDTVLAPVNGIQATTSLFGSSFLTSEEQRELDGLKDEHNRRIVLAKQAAFAKLPRDVREFVVNHRQYIKAFEEIRELEVEPPPRLLELNEREWGSPLIAWRDLHYFDSSALDIEIGLTHEEIERAHIDACAEEMLTEPDNAGAG